MQDTHLFLFCSRSEVGVARSIALHGSRSWHATLPSGKRREREKIHIRVMALLVVSFRENQRRSRTNDVVRTCPDNRTKGQTQEQAENRGTTEYVEQANRLNSVAVVEEGILKA